MYVFFIYLLCIEENLLRFKENVKNYLEVFLEVLPAGTQSEHNIMHLLRYVFAAFETVKKLKYVWLSDSECSF
jgi:hypothetical protein